MAVLYCCIITIIVWHGGCLFFPPDLVQVCRISCVGEIGCETSPKRNEFIASLGFLLPSAGAPPDNPGVGLPRHATSPPIQTHHTNTHKNRLELRASLCQPLH